MKNIVATAVQVAQAREDLDTLTLSLAREREHLTVMEAGIKTAEARIKQLAGGWRVTGEIPAMKSKLANLKRAIADQELRRVVWVEPRPVSEDDYVVTRVTPQRVYVRQLTLSDFGETYYDKVTGKPSYGLAIDIDATFPEGVEAYAEKVKAKAKV